MLSGFLCVLMQMSLSASGAYPRPDLLVEPAELAKPAIAEGFVILDARAKDQYEAGHVPGALWVDHESWSKSFAAEQDPKEWSGRLGEIGIGNNSRVVVYDDAMSKNAARIWWIVRYWGVRDARILNGGWQGWSAANLPISKELATATPRTFRADAPAQNRLATKEKILDLLKVSKTQIVDARSDKEYCGDELLKNKKGGAIPGAINLEWSDALDKTSQRFKSPEELVKILKDAGIDVNRPTVTYCQSGGRAAVMAFTLELMGGADVANYYRSWSEWGNADDTPIATPMRK